ncbi:MAG: glutathione peroxidase [Gammaproteobacteria bacterium]
MEIHNFELNSLTGESINFSKFKGKVLVIVNVASKCGFTPQYKDLEELYKKYKDQGLEVLGFPCNQFGKQEPGSSNEIKEFCELNYGVSFQMFEKIDVNGENASPLYNHLKNRAPGVLGSKSIKWNFTKFLVDRNGMIIKRFGSKDAVSKIEKEIKKIL